MGPISAKLGGCWIIIALFLSHNEGIVYLCVIVVQLVLPLVFPAELIDCNDLKGTKLRH